ncbi:MAG: hypothetical protein IT210_20635 [Armatimonadetes bacterium]|nr:hypothetical protein [Armatimonadota bacterium]
MLLFSLFAGAFLAVASVGAQNSEGYRANSISLNGSWEFARGDGSEAAETAVGARRLQWQKVDLPGSLMRHSDPDAANTRFAWVRRKFSVSAAQAGGLAVLRWNQITFGAVAYINGRWVGENAPTGPYRVMLSPGTLKPGENTVTLKIAGGQGAPKSKSGYLLIPAGFGDTRQPPAVQGDVWIDFADTAYMKWILALPDLTESKVRIRVTPSGFQRAEGLRLAAQVRSWPDGQTAGSGIAPARVEPETVSSGGAHLNVVVPMPGFKPWTYEEPNLYTAEVSLRKGEKVLDQAVIRFGMREIRTAGGHYLLNGKTLRLRGSELVFEWQWASDRIDGKEKDYLVTEAREMSMNAFRTHTMPPPPLWADICDENGTMILAEFPCLYNYVDYRFTPEEYAVWHKNVLSDAEGWMARLWNHPSVVMWVISNESSQDSAWETGPYHDFVRALDPTRPTMRTGDTGTPENYDVHTCGNTVDPIEGELIQAIPGWFRQANGRPVTNSEYMNIFDRPITQWTGTEDKEADALAYAQLGMEHTEAMRRARLDAVLPYMYAGWTKTRTGQEWKAGFARPVSACWHSALSPAIASLDLFDPDYLTGQEVKTDLYLINDSWHDARIHVDLLLTDRSPDFIPEAECLDRPLAKWSYDFTLKADTLTKAAVTWKLPDRESSYWLTARTTGVPGRPALSQRFIRAVEPPDASSLRDLKFVILAGDDAAEAWFRSRNLQTEKGLSDLTPGRHVAVIWNAAHLTAEEKRQAGLLRAFAAAGGRVVALETGSWDWAEMCDIRMGDIRGSRVFPYQNAKHGLLSAIRPDWLMRWNGLPGTVSAGNLDGPAMAKAEKLLWVREPQNIVVAEVPLTGGKGTVLFSQLDIKNHLDRNMPGYDPAAEKVFIAMLQGKQP